MNNIWKNTLLITSIILLDQFSKGFIQKIFLSGEEKILIPKFMSIIYVQDSSMALGLGDHWNLKTRNIFLNSFSLLILMWATFRITILRGKYLKSLPYVLVVSGLIGNLVDRLLYGHVVSFIKIGSWIFNFSDISILLAIILSIFNMIYFSGKKSASPAL